jgi:hypothetical protein
MNKKWVFLLAVVALMSTTVYGQRNRDTVAVTVYTNNPTEVPQGTYAVGFLSWNRGVDGLANGIVVEGDYRVLPELDITARIGATGFLSSSSDKPLAFEGEVSGAYWLTSTIRDKAKQMVPLRGGSYMLNTRLAEEVRLGGRGGVNFASFTYAKKGNNGFLVDYVINASNQTVGTLDLQQSSIATLFAGVCYENRSHATLNAEGFGDIVYVRRTIIYADVLYAPAISATFKSNLYSGESSPANYDIDGLKRNLGVRGGFKKIISFGEGNGFVTLMVEGGAFPSLDLPKPTFSFYLRAGGTIGLFY